MRRRFIYRKKNKHIIEPVIDIDNYLTIVALENGLTAALSGNTVEYCVDGDGNWKSLSSNMNSESINKGQTLSFRGTLTPTSSKGVGTFKISKSCDLTGNCNSLLFGDGAVDNLDLTGKDYTFYKLFYICRSIKNVSSNFLPATTLAIGCYNSMFMNCTSLTTAPALSATTLATYCYERMFYGCSSLTTAPALPATTLAIGCYNSMFDNCYSLATAPQLPATTLAIGCYNSMFMNCTSLTTAPQLPSTTLASNCYQSMFYYCTSLTTAPALPATTLASNCYQSMFYYCTSLTTAPALPATTLAIDCYRNMFRYCTSLTTAPELPATTLASNCYEEMFYDCDSLATAPELPATTLAEYCYSGMFDGCSKLTTAPQLPATTLADSCYYSMFRYCTSLTTTPELPATTLASSCYNEMFYGTNVLPDCSNIDFSSSTVVASGGLKGLFAGTKVTDDDLRSILPINSNGKYYLPCTTLAIGCYEYMFYNCSSLTTAPELPATTLADDCYRNMFRYCTSLTTAPELPAITLADSCYSSMFYGCRKLNYIKAMFTTLSSNTYIFDWVYGVASSGTFVKNKNATWDVTGTHGIPSGWTVQTVDPSIGG